ncbi:MAG: hypothetical protein HYX60_11115 [Legionella longbeachae]|nr:hypothetical protein [Legionella longbeachae]
MQREGNLFIDVMFYALTELYQNNQISLLQDLLNTLNESVTSQSTNVIDLLTTKFNITKDNLPISGSLGNIIGNFGNQTLMSLYFELLETLYFTLKSKNQSTDVVFDILTSNYNHDILLGYLINYNNNTAKKYFDLLHRLAENHVNMEQIFNHLNSIIRGKNSQYYPFSKQICLAILNGKNKESMLVNFIDLLIKLKQYGLTSEHFTNLTNDLNIRVIFKLPRKPLFDLINARDYFDIRILKGLSQRKEELFHHICTMPMQEKRAALNKSIRNDNPLGMLFYIQRGLRKARLGKGTLKLLQEQLDLLPNQEIQLNQNHQIVNPNNENQPNYVPNLYPRLEDNYLYFENEVSPSYEPPPSHNPEVNHFDIHHIVQDQIISPNRDNNLISNPYNLPLPTHQNVYRMVPDNNLPLIQQNPYDLILPLIPTAPDNIKNQEVIKENKVEKEQQTKKILSLRELDNVFPNETNCSSLPENIQFLYKGNASEKITNQVNQTHEEVKPKIEQNQKMKNETSKKTSSPSFFPIVPKHKIEKNPEIKTTKDSLQANRELEKITYGPLLN